MKAHWSKPQTRFPILDPLYGPIECDDVARAIIDTPPFQRLRRIRQLSTASLVYPGAQHTRFEHSLGVYSLARRVIRIIAERGELEGVDDDDIRLIEWAALLHDLSHGVASHVLEDSGVWPVTHEEVGARAYLNGEIGAILAGTGIPDAARRIGDIVCHASANPLVGLVSGDCDADKVDYLRRDAYHCGLDAGFDQERLCAGIRLLTDPTTGERSVGIDHVVLLPFERMLYAKNALYRDVYFHPLVVSAACMLRALIVTALHAGLVTVEEVQEWTDEEALMALELRVGRRRRESEELRLVTALIERLRVRRLYSVAASLPLAAAPVVPRGMLLPVERALADLFEVPSGSLLLDVPHKPTMLSADLLVRLPGGVVRRAADLTPADGFAMNAMRDALHDAAFHVRLFTAERMQVTPQRFHELLLAAIEMAAGSG